MPELTVRRRDERGHLSWVAALGLVLLVGGSILYLKEPAPVAAPPQTEVQQTVEQPRSRPPASIEGAVLRKYAHPPWSPGVPQEVVIESLGVDADVVPISTVADTLIPPGDPQVLGWWRDGAMTGAETGSALVTGHTVHTGGGALDNLEQMEVGQTITVRTGRGVIEYEVDAVHVYSKGTIARDAEELFSQEVEGRLVLITCEDWDGVQYLSNAVVVASPVWF